MATAVAARPSLARARVGPGRELLVGSGVALAVVCSFVVAPISDGSASVVRLESLGRVLVVLIPVAVGLYAWRSGPFARFGTLLVASGVVWLVATCSLADAALPYSLGRVGFWIGWATLLCLVLTFPEGRLTNRIDRFLVVSLLIALVVLYLPTALLVHHYPRPAPWATCYSHCPPNAFMVTSHQPGVITHVVVPLRELLTTAVFLAIVARLVARIASASRIRRRTLTPVLVLAIVEILFVTLGLVVREAAPGSTALAVAVWLIAFALPAMAVGFMIGVVRWRLYVSASLRRFAASLRSPQGAEEVRAAFADAFEDPSLEIIYPIAEGRWVAADGHRVPSPEPRQGRRVSELRNYSNDVVAALVHDEALAAEDAFINAIASYATLSLENQRLAADVAHLASEMRTTQARAAASADHTRQQIERDLHDGAQQRLIGLQFKLQLAAERSGADGVRAEELNKLTSEVQLVMNELRTMARGVFPAALSDFGPITALRGAVRDSPVPTALDATGLPRYSAEMERALYFCCLEGLQNAYKHARGVSLVRIKVAEHRGTIAFEIADDGSGFEVENTAGGAGLRNMDDRVASLGGTLEVVSSPGRGTVVRGVIPVTTGASAAPAAARHG